MAVDIISEIVKNKFLLLLLQERDYTSKLGEIINTVKKTRTKICYVCLSKPYTDIVSELKEKHIETDEFFFVDTMSSHYSTPEPKENCIFIDGPYDLDEIRSAIKKAVTEKKCSVIIMDTVSTLLVYQESFPIMKFTNFLVTDKEHENVKKLFIVLKDEHEGSKDSSNLVKDLTMLADKTIDM